MTFDPFKPQPYNVDIGNEPEAADEQPRFYPIPVPVPYVVPVVAAIEPDNDLYPPRPYGVWVQGV